MTQTHKLNSLSSCDEVSYHMHGRQAVIVLRGEIDIDIQSCFARVAEMLHPHTDDIVVDAEGVEFIDSSGIAVLGQIAHNHPGRVTLLNAPPTMLFILEVTQLIDVIRLESGHLTKYLDSAVPTHAE
ncbi:STAS domain-containing protein [Jonesia denitrificans]|uniref:Anti-sigma-factor antagonist n=1 Tax=Jonesia denitrificans (strain ATCC 14870 / DSM 20603 / BCRC 15368 / CIP 55.134 / JCM 11481 / NBRC 15587 / NCTC 10816 / Prevot 55134) TaxID=471856 RepID=C7R2R0_JONDD|nr:STAS domain-containing protein [Jonesia denitrificans]ACV10051.1 anti-sigma-factor antagonist [Jonesia denitrificans DSM 20603]QXB43325.1 STAS domain-containing protein [Jonesia denitrificans]SQH22872.1 anti-anti-sigma factor [Jonesia denitrificans]